MQTSALVTALNQMDSVVDNAMRARPKYAVDELDSGSILYRLGTFKFTREPANAQLLSTVDIDTCMINTKQFIEPKFSLYKPMLGYSVSFIRLGMKRRWQYRSCFSCP